MIKFSPPMVALANLAEMWMNNKSLTQQLQLVLNDAIALNASEQQMLKSIRQIRNLRFIWTRKLLQHKSRIVLQREIF